MNIEGNKVIWNKNKSAVTNTKNGFTVYKQITTENEDGITFRFWSDIDSFDDLDTAIAFAKEKVLEKGEIKNE